MYWVADAEYALDVSSYVPDNIGVIFKILPSTELVMFTSVNDAVLFTNCSGKSIDVVSLAITVYDDVVGGIAIVYVRVSNSKLPVIFGDF